MRSCACTCRSATPWPTPTATWSSIATSSRRTCCWIALATCPCCTSPSARSPMRRATAPRPCGAPPPPTTPRRHSGAATRRPPRGTRPASGPCRTPHAATEADTTRPSLLVRDASDAYHRHYVPLKSDLDRVLLKALAEEPGQRYATAEALADDLRRWLDGQPVLAEKPGVGYRLRKFVARNRMGVAAGALLALSLAGGIGATLWQAEAARSEAENARAQAQRAVLVRDFLEEVFTSTEP